MQPDEEKFEGKVNRCQAPKKKSLKREGAGMREPFHQMRESIKTQSLLSFQSYFQESN